MTRRVRYVLVLIDFQAEHTPEIQNSERVVARAIALASAARRAGVRCVGIETQAVSGGPLIANIRLRRDDVMGPEALAGINADRLILAGCETHGAVLAAIPEAAFAMLACARIGAIHSVVFRGFASVSLATRIDDANPKVIVSADAGSRGGKVIPYKPLLDEALKLSEHQSETTAARFPRTAFRYRIVLRGTRLAPGTEPQFPHRRPTERFPVRLRS